MASIISLLVNNNIMDFWEEFTKNLSLLINSSSKSKTQIAQELGVTQSCISNYISGASYPSLEALKKLCQILDCDYKDILGEIK